MIGVSKGEITTVFREGSEGIVKSATSGPCVAYPPSVTTGLLNIELDFEGEEKKEGEREGGSV
jgi:hypothetical protein